MTIHDRISRNLCSMLSWGSHLTFLMCVWIFTVHFTHSSPAGHNYTSLHGRWDEEVRKYPGHFKAKIRPKAWSWVPDTHVCADLLLVDGLCAGAMPGPGSPYTFCTYSLVLNPHDNSQAVALSSHFTEEESKAQNNWQCFCDIMISYNTVAYPQIYPFILFLSPELAGASMGIQ